MNNEEIKSAEDLRKVYPEFVREILFHDAFERGEAKILSYGEIKKKEEEKERARKEEEAEMPKSYEQVMANFLLEKETVAFKRRELDKMGLDSAEKSKRKIELDEQLLAIGEEEVKYLKSLKKVIADVEGKKELIDQGLETGRGMVRHFLQDKRERDRGQFLRKVENPEFISEQDFIDGRYAVKWNPDERTRFGELDWALGLVTEWIEERCGVEVPEYIEDELCKLHDEIRWLKIELAGNKQRKWFE